MQQYQSDSKERVMVLKQSFQKSKTKDLITIFALNVLDVADGKWHFAAFLLYGKLNIKR